MMLALTGFWSGASAGQPAPDIPMPPSANATDGDRVLGGQVPAPTEGAGGGPSSGATVEVSQARNLTGTGDASGDGYYERDPSLLMSSSGTWFLIYSRSQSLFTHGGSPDGLKYDVYARTSTDSGATWSAETEVLDAGAISAESNFRDATIVEADGRVWVIGADIKGLEGDIYANTYSGAAWAGQLMVFDGTFATGAFHLDAVAEGDDIRLFYGVQNESLGVAYILYHGATDVWDSTPTFVGDSAGHQIPRLATSAGAYYLVSTYWDNLGFTWTSTPGTIPWPASASIFAAPSGGAASDPGILKYGSSDGTDDLIVFHAPWYSSDAQPLEYIYSTDAGATWSSSIPFTDAEHTWGVSWDMMPRAYLKDAATIMVLASMEHRGVARGQGDIALVEFLVSSIGRAHYTTIQDGIDNAAAGDQVSVAAGTYVENVWVNKSLELAGAGAATTTILPAVSLPNPCAGSSLCGSRTAASNIILTEASDITIHGFTLDGDNPALSSGIVRGGADLDARNGIIEYGPGGVFNNLVAYDTTVKNIYLRGIYANSYGSGFYFHDNSVQNVQGEANSIAIFNFGGSGIIEENAVAYANDAIAANHSKGTQFLSNFVTNSGSGVHTDNNGSGGGTADLIQGNSVTCAGSGYGVWVFYPYLAATLDQNTITGCDVGLSAWAQGDAVTPQFTDNTVTGPSKATGSVGAYITTDSIGWGYTDVSVGVSNNLITDFETGVYLTADAQSWNPDPWVSKTVNSVFFDNSFGGNTYGMGMGTTGTYSADASANWWGSADPAAVKAAANGGSIVDYTPWLAAGTDTSADPGFQGDSSTLWVDDDSPQTGTTNRIKEGIALVSGSTVNVAPGTYVEQVTIDKSLVLAGADAATTFIQAPSPMVGDASGSKNIVTVTGSGVAAELSGFTIEGPGSADLNVGIYVRDGADANIHDNTLEELGSGSNTLGILVGRKAHSTTGTASITANSIGGYDKGGIVVDNSGSSATITGNTVTGAGADPVTAQNGIQISRLATATVTGNTVADHYCASVSGGCTDDPTTSLTADGASGILLYVSGAGVVVSGNTLTGNQYAVWTVAAADVQLLQNTITGASGTGIAIWDSDQWTVSLGYSPVGTAGTVSNNILSTHQYGLLVRDYTAGGVAPSVTVSENSVSGNSVWGAWADVDVNASGNWWGSADPAVVKATANNGSHIDYTPWLASGTDTGDPGFQGDFSTLWVDDDSPQTGTTGRIQEGINLVSGSTVNVAGGTYVEQPVINKNLALIGVGDPIVQAPSTVSYLTFPEGGSYQWEPVVLAFGGTLVGSAISGPEQVTVDIDGLIVDGASRVPNPTSRRAVGILYRNVLGGVDGCTVRNMGYSTASVNSWGIMAYGTSDVLLHGNDVSGYAKGGFVVNGVVSNPALPKPNAVIDDNIVTGPPYDPLMTLAPNGIQIGWGATGSITNNTVTNNGYPGTDWGGSGILVQSSPNVVVDGNTLTGNEYGIAVAGYTSYGGSFSTGTIVQNNTVGGSVLGIYLNQRSVDTLIQGNTISDNEYGIQVGSTTNLDVPPVNTDIHDNVIAGNTTLGLYVVDNALQEVVDAERNWWGEACGPVTPANLVSGNVDYIPWWSNSAMTIPGPIAGMAVTVPAGATTPETQAILNCAGPGSTVTFESGSYPGGLFVNNAQLTLKLNTCTVGGPAPAFTIVGDDEVLEGPGTIAGTGSGSGIVVNAGADNFILEDAQVTGWANGIELAGDVESFKVMDNWIHSNTENGLLVDADVDLLGVVTIDGNLLKVNGLNGIQHNGNGTLPAEYNSWGDIGGYSTGDGIGGDVDADPFTYIESFFDVWPDGLVLERHVPESTSFDVALKADAVNVYGVSFEFTYDAAVLTLGTTTFSAPWAGKCYGSGGGGVVSYVCALMEPEPEWTMTAGTIATFHFTAYTLPDDLPVTTYLDLLHLEADSSAGAKDGQRIYVNNAGFNDASTPERAIADTDDGRIIVERLANYTGYIDLQGRANDSGALLEVHAAPTYGSTLLASGTSASSGKYATSHIAPYWLGAWSTYWFQVDRSLYLPTTAVTADNYDDSAVLSVVPLTALAKVVLLGGDASDDDKVLVTDLACIGGNYGGSGIVCSGTGWTDVNGDGIVNVQDLSMAGGNLYKTSSPWTP